jgi:hypothetical protein
MDDYALHNLTSSRVKTNIISSTDLDNLKLQQIMRRLSDQKKLTDFKRKGRVQEQEMKIQKLNKKNKYIDANPNLTLTSLDKMKNSRINFRLDKQQELASTFDRAVADYANGIIEAPKDTRTTQEKLADTFYMKKLALDNAVQLFGDKEEAWDFLNQSFVNELYIQFFNKNFPAISKGIMERTSLPTVKFVTDFINKYMSVLSVTKGVESVETALAMSASSSKMPPSAVSSIPSSGKPPPPGPSGLTSSSVPGVPNAGPAPTSASGSPVYNFVNQKHTVASLNASVSPSFNIGTFKSPADFLRAEFGKMPDLNATFKDMADDYDNVPIGIKQLLADYLGVALTPFDDPSIGAIASTSAPYTGGPPSNGAVLRAQSPPPTSGSGGSAVASGGVTPASAPTSSSTPSSNPIDTFSFDKNIIASLENISSAQEKEYFISVYNDVLDTKSYSPVKLNPTESNFDDYLNMIIEVYNYLVTYQSDYSNGDDSALINLTNYYDSLADKYDFDPSLDVLEGSIEFLGDIADAYGEFISSSAPPAATAASNSATPYRQDIYSFFETILANPNALSLEDKNSLISGYNTNSGSSFKKNENTFNRFGEIYNSLYDVLQSLDAGDSTAQQDVENVTRNNVFNVYKSSGLDSIQSAQAFIQNINSVIDDVDLIEQLKANQGSNVTSSQVLLTPSSAAPAAGQTSVNTVSPDTLNYCNNLIAGNIPQSEWEMLCNAIEGSQTTWTRSNKVSLQTAQYLADVTLKLVGFFDDPSTYLQDIIDLNVDSLFTDSTDSTDILKAAIKFAGSMELVVQSILASQSAPPPSGAGLKNYFSKPTIPKVSVGSLRARANKPAKGSFQVPSVRSASRPLSNYFKMRSNNIKQLKY